MAKADESLQQVLREAVRLGDAERNMLCLTYLAVSARFLHDVDRAEAFAHAAMSAARHNGARHYEGVAHSNLAWVAWRRGDRAAALAGIATARQMAVLHGYPFNWFCDMIELASAVEQADFALAAACARSMADPRQQLLREDVQLALDAAAADTTPETMTTLLAVSERAGYV